MDLLDDKQRKIQMVEFYHRNQSYSGARREWRRTFKCSFHEIPSRWQFQNAVEQFHKTGEITDQRKNNCKETSVRTEDTLERIRQSVNESPHKSLARRSSELEISKTTLWRAMTKDLKLYPYKIHTMQNLTDLHKKKRVEMSKMFNTKMENDPRWIGKVWFSDEAHFHLNGLVNRQNYRFWGSENPHLDPQEKPLHSPKVTAWCALSEKGIIGPYWFEDDDGRTTTVNQFNYQEVIGKFQQELRSNRLGATTAWFMQDGATCHTAITTREYLKTLFKDRVISGKTEFPWSPNSPDLNPLDYFLWGYCKDNVYKNNPQNLDELKTEVESFIATITRLTCKKVIQNFGLRLNRIMVKKGSHIEHTIK